MKVESINYSVSGLSCRGELVYDETVRTRRPLLLVAPNWLGVVPFAIEMAKTLAGDRYIAFVADMYGEGGKPKGNENPMEFLKPLMSDNAAMRRRIVAAFETMTREAEKRDIGDAKRRAAIGFCFGGANVIDLARTGADVAAVVSMHGTLATAVKAKRGEVKASILVVHGAADPISPKAERDAFEAEMTDAGARWVMLTFSGVVHNFTDPHTNVPGVAVYYEPASRHGFDLAHGYIADAFGGKL
jgi:dienelactone hydrolase